VYAVVYSGVPAQPVVARFQVGEGVRSYSLFA